MAGRPPTKEAPKFGRRLAAIRKERELTQPQLADLIGMTPKAIDYYERRAKNPSFEFVKKVAEALGLTPDELMGLETLKGKSGPSPKLQKQLEQIQKLSRSKQLVVSQLLEAFLSQNSKA
jgi:transcriptional regulator with XRE-family HTH domain